MNNYQDYIPRKKRRNNPDYWLHIPEFDVMPQDVNFEGFESPIDGLDFSTGPLDAVRSSLLGMNPHTGAYLRGMPGMLHVARKLAHADFKSLKELRQAFDEYQDLCATNQTKKLTTRQVDAARYYLITESLEDCISLVQSDPLGAMNTYAFATEILIA